MTAEAAAMTRSWRVGKYTVTMTAPKLREGKVSFAAMEWHPDMPTQLSKKEGRQYQAGRDAAFEELFAEAGIQGLMVEI